MVKPAQKKDIQKEILNKMKKKINDAKQLIESPKGEKKRWIEDNNRFDHEKRLFICDSVISSDFIVMQVYLITPLEQIFYSKKYSKKM